ncbi:hypothetical protein C8J56DRAFT_923826 [Mycena floridula]|nr:hypothetical protein C8J56DRAFT_923826 [Mycena floridula]
MAAVKVLTTALKPMAAVLSFMNFSQVHRALFPYPWSTSLHAMRISMAYHANAKRTSSQLSWGTHLIGYLVMCWAGMVGSHVLLGIPPPILYSIHPWINYLGVHLFMTFVFDIHPELLGSPMLGNPFFPLDAILRSNAVTLTLSHLSSPNIDPRLSGSPVFHIILGAVVSCAGGGAAATLGTWTPTWSFSTPVFLRPEADFWSLLDVWGGSVVAVVYGIMTAHPAFAPAAAQLHTPIVGDAGGKALATYVLIALFGARVYFTSSSKPAAAKEEKKAMEGEKKTIEEEKKTQ